MGKRDGINALLAGHRTTPVQGKPGWTLRLLSAAEVLQARREAVELAVEDRERAVCSNACLLARALERDGKPAFSSGVAALEGLQIGEIAALAEQWAAFNAEENPSPEDGEEAVEALKKGWSTRLMSALNGACCAALECFRLRSRQGR